MCLLTLIVWAVLVAGVIVTGLIAPDRDAAAYAGIAALVLGVVLPVVLNYWRPLFFRWHKRRQKLRDKLLNDSVLSPDDINRTLRYVQMREVKKGSEKMVSGTKQQAFLLVDQNRVKVFGEKASFTAENFRIIPGCTGRCSRCWVIWACGGDDFRMQATVDGTEREYLLQCREGRTLRDVAKATEMLEELVEVDAENAPASTAEKNDAFDRNDADVPEARSDSNA